MILQFPTLFDALPPADVVDAVTPRPLVRRTALAVGLLLGLGALAGCEGSSAHALLDGPTEPARPAEAVVHPVSAAPAAVHETVNPGSGAVRMPFALQGYGG